MTYKVNIDAGHGSETAGKRTPAITFNADFDNDGVIDVKKGSSIREHWANVGVAVLLKAELEYNGFETNKTGWDDSNAKDDPDEALVARQKSCKAAKCNISVSIHCNAAGDGQSYNNATGVCTYIHADASSAKDSAKLAKLVQAQLVTGTSQTNRGVNKDELALCNAANMGTTASILVEICFMTNEKEAKLMASMDFWRECAQEITKGICQYYGKTYKKKSVSKITVSDGATKATADIKYYVRKTYANVASQLGSYASLDSAKAKVDANKGYYVFDKTGKQVYPVKAATTESAAKPATTTTKKTVTSNNGVNVRAKADVKSTLLGAIGSGKSVEILATDGSFYKVKGQLTTGKTVTGYCTKAAFK